MTAGVDARLAFGADWNPEQWPEDVNRADLALLREAGVTRLSVGVFSWAFLEPRDGEIDLSRLEVLLDALAEAGIGANLATPTASPPWWLLRAHPEIQLVDETGRRVPGGGRLSWCPTSPVFRRYAVRIAGALAARLGAHPALRLWHVGNELGNENMQCFCDSCAEAFRAWLRKRYASLDALNAAWGTAFWGHVYGAWEEIAPPLATRNRPDPALALAYRRFCSDALLAHYRAEVDAIRAAGSAAPVTTNLMIAQGEDRVDNRGWAERVDVVANDHYTVAADADRHIELAFSADRVRGVARGEPWLLMEHSTSAVNWQRHNRAKDPGELRRDSLSHVARGSDGAMFFQWRASTAGAEQFHSAMVSHAGTQTRIWREVVELGAELRRLAPVAGSRVERAPVALLWSAQAHWAMDAAPPPTQAVSYPAVPQRLYREFFRRGIRVDVVDPRDELDGYRVVVVPTLYLAPVDLAARLEAVASTGATVLVTALSGFVDDSARVIPGGYPGALRDLLGVVGEEVRPLQPGERTLLTNGWRARDWTEDIRTTDAETVAAFAEGPIAGHPAVTARAIGAGEARYLAFLPGAGTSRRIVAELAQRHDLRPLADAPPGVDVVRRRQEATGESFLFCINHTDSAQRLAVHGIDLLRGTVADGLAEVAAGGVAVFAETLPPHAHENRTTP